MNTNELMNYVALASELVEPIDLCDLNVPDVLMVLRVARTFNH